MKLKQEVVGDEDILSEEEVPGQEHIITITHWMELECTVGCFNHGVTGARYNTLKIDQDKSSMLGAMIWGVRVTSDTKNQVMCSLLSQNQ